ncbi:MAG: MetQ/NlpA family ABC transporter substrate-binding protein [Thermodesulfobacteriota bacterium]
MKELVTRKLNTKHFFRRAAGLSLGLLFGLWLIVPAEAAEVLRLGLVPVVDTLPLLAAQEAGLFEKEGLEVRITSFQSALERDAALQAGRLDGYFGDLLNTILLVNAGQKLAILTTAFHTHPRFRVFGLAGSPKSNFKALTDLKGQAVAISRATVIEYLLDRMLAAQGLGADFVVKQEIKQIPIRMQMLLEGQVASALLPEPLLTLAEDKGARVLADDRNLDTCVTVIALNRDRLSQEPTLASRFRKAYAGAVQRINQDPGSYKQLLVTKTNFPAGLKDKYQVPIFPPVGLPAEADVAAAREWLTANRLILRTSSYQELVWP